MGLFFYAFDVVTLAIMVSTLLSHGWKKFTRSTAFSKEITTTIFLGFFAFMMISYSLILGFALNSIITKGLNQADSFTFLNGVLLYYFVIEFVMRYMIQNVPVLDIQPYLHLPMRRSRIMHYLLIKSLPHVLNFFVVLLFLPFTLQVVMEKAGSAVALGWFFSIWAVSLCIHYFVILFKKKLDDNIWGLLSIILLFAFLGSVDYFQWFKLSNVSAFIFSTITNNLYLLIGSISLLATLYFINFNFFLNSVYTDELVTQKSSSRKSQDLAFLQGLGSMGEWINLEIKLILRNKRPRTILFLSVFFLLYGLLFYTNDRYLEGSSFFLLFIGIFITGIFMINYGQYLFSWQGGQFDFTLTRPISLRQFVESKYWLLNTATVICFLLSIPYVYFGWRVFMINTAMALFNLGVNIFIILNVAMWGPKKVNLTKGGSFNYQGVGAAQWIMSIPILAGPYVIYLPFSLLGYADLGLIAIGSLGLLGIVLRSYLLGLTTKRLQKLKYSMASGFRSE